MCVCVCSLRTKSRAAHGMRVVGGTLVDESEMVRTVGIDGTKASADASDSLSAGTNSVSDVSVEVARGALWCSAWDAVRMSTCFTSSGSDLPLHICKHLQELYIGGIDAEFRYSQNVKSMLEIVAVVARPRVVVDVIISNAAVGTEFSKRGDFPSEQFQSMRLLDANEGDGRGGQSGKLGETQLCRGVMSLIRTIRPVDVISFSCFITTLADLCFTGCHYVQLPSMESILFKLSTGNDRTIIFAPVDEQLRSEAGKLLMSAIKGDMPGAIEKAHDNPISDEWLAIAATVTTKKFVDVICGPLLSARMPSSRFSIFKSGDGGMQNLQEISSSENSSRPSGGGFLASLARMLTLDEEDEVVCESSLASHSLTSRVDADSNLFKMIPVHAVVRRKIEEESWTTFPVPHSTLLPFSEVLQTCLRAIRKRNVQNKQDVSDALRQELLVSAACLLSPWLLRKEVITDSPSADDNSVLDVTSDSAHPHWRSELQPTDSKFVESIENCAILAKSVLDAVSLHLISSDW